MLMLKDCRHFHDWQTPALRAGADIITRHWSGQGVLDLRDTWVLVPSQHAGRQLRMELARRTHEKETAVLMGKITPVSGLLLPDENAAIAPPLPPICVQSILARLILDNPQSCNAIFSSTGNLLTFRVALELADWMLSTRNTLAEGGIAFDQVLRHSALPDEERPRWEALAGLNRQLDSRLRKMGALDEALHLAQLPHTLAQHFPFRRLLLLFTNQLPNSVKCIIQALQAADIQIEIHILAPESEAGHFDLYGQPIPEAWNKRPIPLPSENVHSFNQISDELARLREALGHARQAGHDVALCLPDASHAQSLANEMKMADMDLFLPNGIPLAKTPMGITALQWLDLHAKQDYAALSAWLRNPYVEKNAEIRLQNIKNLDKLQNEHLPRSISDLSTHVFNKNPLKKMLNAITEAIQAIQTGKMAWHEALLNKLHDIFSENQIHFDSISPQKAAQQLTDGIWLVRETSEAQQLALSNALALLQTWVKQEIIYPTAPETPTTEVRGWLDIHWTHAPTLFLADMREGLIPETQVGDLLLPDSLRKALGLLHNDEKMARDVHWLTALLASHTLPSGIVHIFFSRRDEKQNSQKPSRLLLACEPTQLPERIRLLFHDVPTETPPPAEGLHTTLTPFVPIPRTRNPFETQTISVSQINDYLTDPFVFYLKHILGMEALDDAVQEINAPLFGTLAHNVLKKLKDSNDISAEQIATTLETEFQSAAKAQFGKTPALAVQIQLASLWQRLQKAADVQAQILAEGWKIMDVEKKFEIKIGNFTLQGRFDRIDFHPEKGWRIIDYKTSDKNVKPKDAHLKNATWINLQLPLYRHLFEPHADGHPIELAYFNLPKAVSETAIHTWSPSDEEMAEALKLTEGILADIEEQHFWSEKRGDIPPGPLDVILDTDANLLTIPDTKSP